jgi:DMSO/TMAO reductase YedYZ heme-binding membrane subunit
MRWVYFVLAIVAGGLFYSLRGRNRILYGCIEILVGIIIFLILFSIIPTPDVLVADDLGTTWPTVPNIVSLFTGIYAMVRGLDNIITELRS